MKTKLRFLKVTGLIFFLVACDAVTAMPIQLHNQDKVKPDEKIDLIQKNEKFFQSIKRSLQIGDRQGLQNAYSNIGETYSKMNQPKLAIIYINNGLYIAKETNNQRFVKKAYQQLASLYKEVGDYRQSFECQQLAVAYNDSLLSEDASKKNPCLQFNYQKNLSAKTKQIGKKQLQVLEAKKQNFFSPFFTLATACCMAVVIFSVRSYKIKQRST
jgi:tetratricopeptide (TPR) repeat protein